MYKLAIFDMDGTLLDTIEDIKSACNYALQANGFAEHNTEEYKRFVGDGLHMLIKRALAPGERPETIAKVKADSEVWYTLYPRQAGPYEGMGEALAALRAAGVKLAIFSNKPHEIVCELAAEHFPGMFEIAYGQREGVPNKPDPTVVNEIVRQFGFKPEECAFIGDSGVDMRVGKAAGLYAIGADWGFRTKEELESSGADIIIDKCAELEKILIDK